jgi:AcrR family transcriptional regulator
MTVQQYAGRTSLVSTMSSPGRPRDPELDRRIAQAALDVFGELGWAGFAMEVVARRAGVGKPTLYRRWTSKEALLNDAMTIGLTRVADVDTGSLHGDLVELARQILDLYAGPSSAAALRLSVEAAAIPGVSDHYQAVRTSRILAARAIVRRGIARGDLPESASVTMLLDTLIGGAMMHAMSMPADRRDDLAADTAQHAHRLVNFLMHAVTAEDA